MTRTGTKRAARYKRQTGLDQVTEVNLAGASTDPGKIACNPMEVVLRSSLRRAPWHRDLFATPQEWAARTAGVVESTN